MKTQLLALIDELVKSELYVTEGKFSAAKDAKRIRADIVFLLDKREQSIVNLRHLYKNLVNGGVRDATSAKRIAEGLLAPAIEALESAQCVTPAEYPPLPRPAWNAKTIRATEEAFSADQMRAHYDLGRAGRAQAPVADLINKIIQGCCESDIAAPGYIDTISISVSDLRGVLECNIEGSQAPVAKCETCNDNGLIGGPSFYDPGEGGVPCPDCSAPAAVEPIFEGGRESVDDAIAVVESFGPGIEGLNDTFARQILLADEVKRLRRLYDSAVTGRADMRDALREARHGAQPVKLDFTKPLETDEGKPVKWIAADVIEYKCARVCVDVNTGLVYSSPYVGLKIRNATEAPAAVEPVEIDYPHEQMDALALARYKVLPSDQSMYWRHAVVAGEGLQHLYNGSEVDCQIMARKFAGAFLDGAFTFHQRYTAPRAQPSDALDAKTIPAAVEPASGAPWRERWFGSGGKACTELEAELVHEAQRTAAEKLRADQMTEQHRMQSAMNAEARGELAQLREKRQPTQLYRLLRSGELMREGDECLDDGTMTWHPVRNGWHSFPWSVINNPVRRVIEAAHNITGEPA